MMGLFAALDHMNFGDLRNLKNAAPKILCGKNAVPKLTVSTGKMPFLRFKTGQWKLELFL